jgi:hypothetical protein
MIEDLEGMYERSLEEGSGAFDPTWMWEELGLDDLARGRSRKQTVPRLPHEVIADLEPDVAEVAAEIGERARHAARGDLTRVIDRQEIDGDLGFHRLVRAAVRDATEDGAPEPVASATGAILASWIEILANFELHLVPMWQWQEVQAMLPGQGQGGPRGPCDRAASADRDVPFERPNAEGAARQCRPMADRTRVCA